MLEGSEKWTNTHKNTAAGVEGFVLSETSRQRNAGTIWKLSSCCCHGPRGKVSTLAEVPYWTGSGGCKNWCWAHVITWTPGSTRGPGLEEGVGEGEVCVSALAGPGSGGHFAQMQSVTLLLTCTTHWHAVTQRKLKLRAGSSAASWNWTGFQQHSPLLISRFHKLVLMEFMQFTHAWLYNFSPFHCFDRSPHCRDPNQKL